MDRDRRKLLKTGGTLLAAGLAGCAGNNEDSSTTDFSTSNTTETTPEENSTNTTKDNNTDTEEPTPNIPDSYRADRKRIASTDAEPENIGNYNTEQEWDDIVTDIPELRETQERVLEEQAYTPLVNQVMSGEDFEAGGHSFPNVNYDENDPGHFDQNAVQQEDDFETIVRWYLPAIMHHDRQNYGNAPSSRNDRFAATLETLINEHHPSAEAVSTSVKALPAHGIFGVQDKNNEEFYLVDTTSSAQFDQTVAKIGEDFVTSENGNRSELWDPYHEFEPGAPNYGTYEGKSEKSMAALTRFVTKGARFDIENEERQGKPFITDQWMDDAYEVLRNGGSIQSIVEPIEDMLYERETNNKENFVGIYGTLDDTRIAVTSDEEIFETVMYDQTTTPGIEEIETMLETA